uniref:Putative LOV domain-containing protein n=1 Tax=Bryopsis plumosa TaxID=3130 RepID=A0A126WZ15_BRYPL|nr:putative LOV domain-containing protein [Bryopsis plumosa]
MKQKQPSCSTYGVDQKLESALGAFDFAFVVTDPSQRDNPIRFASEAFYDLTGYSPNEVLNRNCRFLQGPETERRKVMEVRDAIREDRACKVCLLNYKKSGEKFWNQLYLEPILDENNSSRCYVGVLVDVTESLQKAIASKGVSMEDAEVTDEILAIAQSEEKSMSDICSMLLEDLQIKDTSCFSRLPASLMASLTAIQQSFVLVDAQQPDMPIVHAGETFIKMTGYPRDHVIGQNCRFLQGHDTDPKEIAKIRSAISSTPPSSVTTTILNYRYDGTPFWNALHISPIRGADGNVAFFVGVQLDVTRFPKTEEGGAVGRPKETVPECGLRGSRMPLKHKLAHSGTVGSVKIAVRSLTGGERGLRRDRNSCELPRRGSVDYS